MTDAPLIVTFCNRDYIPVLANFLAAPGAPRPAAMRIYGLDPETVAFAQGAGLVAESFEWRGQLRGLWEARIGLFQALLAKGRSFVHSDVDAVWLRNPLTEWLTAEPDMSFSQGTIHPPQVHAATGFVLCCGLFRMNASQASADFLDRVAADIQKTGDDQTSVNRVLLEAGTVWERTSKPDYRLQMQGKHFSCWKHPIEGVCAELGLRVKLIPHSVVQRIHDPIDTAGRAYVKHLLAPKNAAEKLDQFQEDELLFIRPDWRELPRQASFDDFRR